MTGSRALITGASRGLGAAFARIAAADGCDLVLSARTRPDLDRMAHALRTLHGIQVQVVACDLSEPGAAERLWAAAGPVDILVNNAGLGGSGDVARRDTRARDGQMIAVNFVAAATLAKLAAASMIARGQGRILNVVSLAGFLPGPNMAVYFATKAGMRSLSEALWQETRGRGVTVTALCPGPVDTDFFAAGGLGGGRAMLPAGRVARDGWDAMHRGRRVVVPGRRYRAVALLCGLLPRALLLPLAARVLNHRPARRTPR
ncbi:SDR family NAD(P)-dependent oxidoreductase [Palleronia rufa]|uniref:SDR family NAD(P)-dependent oxidoreductase n=1 Tax=Palleronia rufa TaxID=1530186 RepID=UPI00055EB078|nr:SDR family NAD(P)-dependent oxidoreductase [Palleronia rufa]